MREGEVGAELEAAVAMVRGFLRGVGYEKEKKDCYGYVYHNGNFAHSLFYNVYFIYMNVERDAYISATKCFTVQFRLEMGFMYIVQRFKIWGCAGEGDLLAPTGER